MRKLIAILIISAFALKAGAQSFTKPSGATSGTVTNTGIDTLKATVTGFNNAVGIQVVVTKTSGTVAGTSVLLQSIDGVNYIATDTLTLANQAINTKIFYKPVPVGNFWMIKTTGSGTMVATTAAKYSARKQP